MGVKDLRKENIGLLCKWWWKFESGQGLWLTIVRRKYLGNGTVPSVKMRNTDSPSWKALLKVRPYYLHGRQLVVRNGEFTRLWEDVWGVNDTPFCAQFSDLYSICLKPQITLRSFLENMTVVTFRRRLTPVMQVHWETIKKHATEMTLTIEQDQVSWKFEKSGRYSVKSMYKWLEKDLHGAHHRWIWKAKLPLKIKSSYGSCFRTLC